jgi:hypothetical protein
MQLFGKRNARIVENFWLLHQKWGRMNPNVPVNPKRPTNFLELKDPSENLTSIENDTSTPSLTSTWNK